MTFFDLVASGDERIERDVPLGARTTYRVGGSAAFGVTLKSLADAIELVPVMQGSGLPIVTIGNGSNTLILDGHHEVIAVFLDGELADLKIEKTVAGVLVTAGAGADLPRSARRLTSEGVAGFEWAVGVPGTFGGAVVMNAGGHGSEMSASVISVSLFRDGALVELPVTELGFGYRHSAIQETDLVVRVTLKFFLGDVAEGERQLKEIVSWRRENQPGGRNAGSVFRNPEGHSAGVLIESAQCKGLRVGSAEVSTKHANFIQSDPDGSADDIFALMNEVRRRVFANSGIELRAENRVLKEGKWV
jgi:UDP-N-acetylmuramate dehydrogenase